MLKSCRKKKWYIIGILGTVFIVTSIFYEYTRQLHLQKLVTTLKGKRSFPEKRKYVKSSLSLNTKSEIKAFWEAFSLLKPKVQEHWLVALFENNDDKLAPILVTHGKNALFKIIQNRSNELKLADKFDYTVDKREIYALMMIMQCPDIIDDKWYRELQTIRKYSKQSNYVTEEYVYTTILLGENGLKIQDDEYKRIYDAWHKNWRKLGILSHLKNVMKKTSGVRMKDPKSKQSLNNF